MLIGKPTRRSRSGSPVGLAIQLRPTKSTVAGAACRPDRTGRAGTGSERARPRSGRAALWPRAVPRRRACARSSPSRETSARRSGGTGRCGWRREISLGQQADQRHQDRRQGDEQEDDPLHEVGHPERQIVQQERSAVPEVALGCGASGNSVAFGLGNSPAAWMMLGSRWTCRAASSNRYANAGAVRRARPGWRWWRAARCPDGAGRVADRPSRASGSPAGSSRSVAPGPRRGRAMPAARSSASRRCTAGAADAATMIAASMSSRASISTTAMPPSLTSVAGAADRPSAVTP